MKGGLIGDTRKGDSSAIGRAWKDCAAATELRERAGERKDHMQEIGFDAELRATYLHDLVCNAPADGRRFIAGGMARNWFRDGPDRPFSRIVARGLAVADSKGCAASDALDEAIRVRLRAAAKEQG